MRFGKEMIESIDVAHGLLPVSAARSFAVYNSHAFVTTETHRSGMGRMTLRAIVLQDRLFVYLYT